MLDKVYPSSIPPVYWAYDKPEIAINAINNNGLKN
jgi:hypothetical protein